MIKKTSKPVAKFVKFVYLKKPLAYPVYNGKKLAIPAGAKNVAVRFRASHLRRTDEYGNEVPLNVYYWHGMVVHA